MPVHYVEVWTGERRTGVGVVSSDFAMFWGLVPFLPEALAQELDDELAQRTGIRVHVLNGVPIRSSASYWQ